MIENKQTQTVTVSRQVCMFSKEITSSSLTVISLARNLCLLSTWYAKDKINKLRVDEKSCSFPDLCAREAQASLMCRGCWYRRLLTSLYMCFWTWLWTHGWCDPPHPSHRRGWHSWGSATHEWICWHSFPSSWILQMLESFQIWWGGIGQPEEQLQQ